MSQTAAFIARISNDRIFGPGERARLRTFTGCGLDENTPGFDLFTGLWWPLRQKNPASPRREVAWLVVKLYSSFPIAHIAEGEEHQTTLPQALGRREPREEHLKKRFRNRFDALLCSRLQGLEPHLRWALSIIRDAAGKKHIRGIDWVQLTDHLSLWDRGEEHRFNRDIRDIWAEQYLKSINQNKKREEGK